MGVWCPTALLPDGWADHVAIRFDGDRIASVVVDASPEGLTRAPGPVVPGMPNVHSHAFQWAMAGLTEVVERADDDFWSWRDQMYRFAGALDPDGVEAIAAMLQASLLEGGYTSVAEFHYLHHQPDGRPYDDPAELSLRCMAAAETTGIGLTLLPVLYRWSGFGRRPPEPRQRRFVHDADALVDLVDRCRSEGASRGVRVGMALHSLRAVDGHDLAHALADLDAIDPTAPLHVHIAEQEAEVEACLAATGQRPMSWLADRVDLGPRWCLVHATHLSPAEVERVAATGAVAGLCPTTEANLGDGLFPAESWWALGGAYGIGSDSHVITDAAEELRWLESGQRLTLRRRQVLQGPAECPGAPVHVGAGLYRGALSGGAKALGQAVGSLAPGFRADLVALDGSAPRLIGRSRDSALDTWVLAGKRSLVRDVWAGGRLVVADGRHVARGTLVRRYRLALARLDP